MLGLAIVLGWTECLFHAAEVDGDPPETTPQIEIIAEPGIALDAGAGALLTES
jgi:hypothetical protein